ncbi:UDP-N-acetylmuramate--L-alanine ligase [Odoribacter sp. OttesenSCG-928-L07]|nr:UDP-N-acetylmuramate--L-alanine ligase [Odoribacter sp. OttesenSCG-928-L07]MDL2239189.1 UDP-N-acetylmuramate--L-alanine ligase [Bacteroidales bacterium OttesenSCG-928-L14]MDL2240533.1 UDP-N-acetylmuramate--L-alanine ligase [Bacteroidales bacterium OttesenSCG-928-K22]
MINLKDIKSVYLIGIGGIGMSALAQYFYNRNCYVAGYDRSPSMITGMLFKLGIDIYFEEDINHINNDVDLIIYTPAIPNTNIELEFAKKNFKYVLKRSEVLQLITDEKFCVAIGGTHGKTTITSMVSHIFNYNNIPITAFIGGISKNVDNNFIDSKDAKISIVEADEYDRSFLKLNPNIALVNAVDADHLDVYKSRELMIDAYREFLEKADENNRIINKKCNKYFNIHTTYGIDNGAKFQVDYYEYEDNLAKVVMNAGGQIVEFDNLTVYGKHNIENFCAAYTIAHKMNVSDKQIESAMQNYKGVVRRFDVVYKNNEIVYVDDYAHHPAEIASLIDALNEVFPNKKICAIFQPHLYSRTRDYMDDFAKELSRFEELYLLDIYPARELPIEGITSEALAGRISKNVKVINKSEVDTTIRNSNAEVFVTIGAGDIDKLVKVINNELINKYGKV